MITIQRTKNFLNFKKTIVKPNIVNHYEIEDFLNQLIAIVPEAEDFIRHKVKKYLYQNLAYEVVNNENQLKNQLDQEHFLSLNKENCTQVILTKALLKDVLQKVVFAKEQSYINSRMSYYQVSNKYRNFIRNNLIKNILKEGELQDIIYFAGGEHIVKLKDYQACLRESYLMKNCLNTYFAQHSYNNKVLLDGIFSFRDKKNKSLASFHLKEGKLIEWKAACNEKISVNDPKFKNLIFFLKKYVIKEKQMKKNNLVLMNEKNINSYCVNMNVLKISIILNLFVLFYFFNK